MWVIVHLSRYYDWVDVPPDVELTPAQIAGPLVMPGRAPGQYRMRVEKAGPTHRTIMIKEADVVSKIVDEKIDVRRSGQTLNRKQAVAHLVKHMLDDGRYAHAQWSWITGFDVHDDGAEVEVFDVVLEPHLTAIHGRTGRVHFTLDEHAVAKFAYLDPTTPADHVDHLHAHFGVPRAPKEASK